MTEWISVNDQLPEKNGKYLTYKDHDINFEYFKDGYFLMMLIPEIRYRKEQIKFTHWMSLPEPPHKK